MDILEHLIARPGETQEGRLPEGLARGFLRIDDRDGKAFYKYVGDLAKHIRFHYVSGGALKDDLDWTPFFPQGKLPASRDGDTPPHLALLAAFLKLHRIPRAALNGITARHLDFFYRRVLGFAPRGAVPDRAHVLVELKKTAAPVKIGPEHLLTAGKDQSGVERIFAPVLSTVVNRAKVEKLGSVYFDAAGGGTVRFAPVANSADGLGGELEGEEPKWPGFGAAALPAAPVGFALASPVLRMKEGTRKVRVELELDGLRPGLAAPLARRLHAFATAPKRWLGPYEVDATQTGARLALQFTVPASDEALADYDAAKHAQAFATHAPVVQFLFKDDAPQGYAELQSLFVVSTKIAVDVSGVKSLQLESDAGLLDPRRNFQPFGPQPMPGARFIVSFPEAMAKRLDELSLEPQWLGGIPSSFGNLYHDYDPPPPVPGNFRVRATLRDAAGRELAPETTLQLFQARLVLVGGEPPPRAFGRARQIQAFAAGGSLLLQKAWQRETLKRPMFRLSVGLFALRTGFITLALEGDFRHGEYRRKLLAGVVQSKNLNEPYTPALSAISLSYKASEEAKIDAPEDAEAFAAAEVELYHLGAFGQRREHAWLRQRVAFLHAKRVPLVPEYPDEGELAVGLSGLGGGDSVSLLFKVAEGSADPAVDPQPQVSWAALCDNYWKPLEGREAVRDGTNNLLRTGIVNLTLPTEASTLSTFFLPGLMWVRASVDAHVNGVCELVSVAANAIEVERRAGGGAALPKGTISKLKAPLAAVKGVSQPFASFGGAAPEAADAFNTRVAERLRHRNRCITAWDYERSVLQAFPEVRKAKCIPHCANRGEWIDPGHVTLVVVPDLRNRNAVDPLQPRADADTLARIRQHLAARSPMGIVIHPRNPRYERVRLDFKVRFRAGVEFNFHARELAAALVDHLSPWVHDPGRAIAFGGAVYKSALIDFVEAVEYVDYVTDFRMVHLRDGAGDADDVNLARAATPDAILVSDAAHRIAPVP
ncbi:MAG: baseplate J/gp47 family protein [Burkholderiales bacterium]